MNDLSKKIKLAEFEIQNKKLFLHQDYALLKNYISTPRFISIGILTSFAFGYLLVQKERKPTQTVNKMLSIPLTLRRIYRQLKIFFPTFAL